MFNMGIGYVVISPADAAEQIQHTLQSQQVGSYVIGQVVAGEQATELLN